MADGVVTEQGIAQISAAFKLATDENRAALMPYLMGGFPSTETATAVAQAYADSGADLIELGIPFSDPLADGPVIHAAAVRALHEGATLDTALETCKAVADWIPVVAMVYTNMILALGAEHFAARLAGAGAAGAIVPDLPLEEQGEIRAALAAAGLALVPLIAPTTPPERRRRIAEAAHGFVYVVSTVGTTGEREQLPEHLRELVAAVRKESPVPTAVGFGISTPEQAAEVGKIADGVIIGTRLVRAVAEADGAEAAADAVAEFLAATRSALAG
ncbi:MAG: tryptophan synthase subunit alpha [Solirubrobacterales bacterium]